MISIINYKYFGCKYYHHKIKSHSILPNLYFLKLEIYSIQF